MQRKLEEKNKIITEPHLTPAKNNSESWEIILNPPFSLNSQIPFLKL